VYDVKLILNCTANCNVMLHHSVIDNQHLQLMLVSSVVSQSYCSLLHQKS